MARILLHDEHEHEHGSWHLTAVLPELAPYRSASDKTLRRCACETNPITRRADTPTTPVAGTVLPPSEPAAEALCI